ncbi:MAG: PAS domain-containing protein [Alphaproteobacteria bacterium]|nr:PAS domain-containing protein [Alphaproteobacteria bacterium]
MSAEPIKENPANCKDSETHRLPFDQIENEKLRQLVQYWESLRKGRKMPSRSDINPVDLSFMLGWIILLEVHHTGIPDDPFHFRYRLVGAELEKVSQVQFQGRWAHELSDNFQRYAALLAFSEAAKTGEPNFYHIILRRNEKELFYERVTLPLTAGIDTKPEMLLVGISNGKSRYYFVDSPAMKPKENN